MTTIEHALLGIHGSLACGLHRRFGWRIAALCGVAAVLPDWDGIPMLFDMAAFENGHRVWGHNIFACAMLGLFVGSVDYRYDLTGWIVRRVSRFDSGTPASGQLDREAPRARYRYLAWVLAATVAAMTQIPADLVVSGGRGLSHWGLQPLWPFSNAEFVYPMIPWGDVGLTVIFFAGLVGMTRWKLRVQPVAAATLALAVAYLVFRRASA